MYARSGGTRDGASSRRAVHSHWGTLDGLRDKRGRGHLDFGACDVGRGATHADRGHNASLLRASASISLRRPIKTPCWIERR